MAWHPYLARPASITRTAIIWTMEAPPAGGWFEYDDDIAFDLYAWK